MNYFKKHKLKVLDQWLSKMSLQISDKRAAQISHIFPILFGGVIQHWHTLYKHSLPQIYYFCLQISRVLYALYVMLYPVHYTAVHCKCISDTKCRSIAPSSVETP